MSAWFAVVGRGGWRGRVVEADRAHQSRTTARFELDGETVAEIPAERIARMVRCGERTQAEDVLRRASAARHAGPRATVTEDTSGLSRPQRASGRPSARVDEVGAASPGRPATGGAAHVERVVTRIEGDEGDASDDADDTSAGDDPE